MDAPVVVSLLILAVAAAGCAALTGALLGGKLGIALAKLEALEEEVAALRKHRHGIDSWQTTANFRLSELEEPGRRVTPDRGA